MDKFVIQGGKKLSGEVSVSGAKNASLALMPASILSAGTSVLINTPELNDVYTMIKLLKHIGADVEFEDHQVSIDSSNITNLTAPYEHVKKMRASVYVLGPLLARYGNAKVSLPGGCAWGPRPIDLHLDAMKKLGAEIDLKGGYIFARANKLDGGKINFETPSVGATGNALMASVIAKGSSVINNAAIEPEICQLAEYLIKMGAKINGTGTKTLEIEGVDELKPAEVITIADRIEAGTLLIAGAITRSKINLIIQQPDLLDTVLQKLQQCGCVLSKTDNSISLDATGSELDPVDITTGVYPGFPTDMQAQWTALMTITGGNCIVTDTIYFDRFKHIPELSRLGADIKVNDNKAVIKGVTKLKGAKVMSTDLRASACLVLAGLAAEGITEVLRVYHLDRGYQRIEKKLSHLGADIKRVQSSEY